MKLMTTMKFAILLAWATLNTSWFWLLLLACRSVSGNHLVLSGIRIRYWYRCRELKDMRIVHFFEPQYRIYVDNRVFQFRCENVKHGFKDEAPNAIGQGSAACVASLSNGELEGMGESVIINGVQYVPDPLHADGVKFYFMHDNHAFTRLNGATIDEVLAHADAVEAGEWGSYGMLCPAILLYGEKEVRRVGPAAHARGSKDPKDHWNVGKAKWRGAVEADVDVMRLMPSNAEFRGAPPIGAASSATQGCAAKGSE